MAESNENPTTPSFAPAPRVRPDPAPARADTDDAIDAALSKATARTAGEPRTAEVSLKRQWDADLEAELEATLKDFDPKTFDTASQRRPRSERVPEPPGGRGQEGSPGIRTGTVIGVRGKTIFVDLGGKSEGVLPVEQFEDAEIPAAGSAIEVVVERFDPDEGVQILRRKGSAVEASWENLKRGIVVEARVTKVIKGGAEVDVDGIRGFLPISQIDLNRVEDAAAYLNQRFKAIVTEANQREKNLVISRRELLSRSAPSSASAPGKPWKKGRSAKVWSARSRASARSSTSMA